MSIVIFPPARKANHAAAPTAITTAPALGSIERQQALHAAGVKAVQAVSILKQACVEATLSGRA